MKSFSTNLFVKAPTQNMTRLVRKNDCMSGEYAEERGPSIEKKKKMLKNS